MRTHEETIGVVGDVAVGDDGGRSEIEQCCREEKVSGASNRKRGREKGSKRTQDDVLKEGTVSTTLRKDIETEKERGTEVRNAKVKDSLTAPLFAKLARRFHPSSYISTQAL